MTAVTTAPSLIQPSLLSRMNERQVLRAIQTHGPMSRAEVARYVGISAPTASKAVEALVRGGWLEEGEAAELVRGRPAGKLRLPGSSAQVLGLVIDADYCRVVSAGLDGTVCDENHQFDSPSTYESLLEQAASHARTLMSRPGVRTLGMGLSVPGLIDYKQQRGILSPNVPITNNHAPARDLSDLLGIECILVQEAHALCLAERYYGNARGLDNFAMLDATSGVGLGVMSGGQLLTGNRGLAGEVGHITVFPNGRQCGCGNFGCLETVACDASAAWAVSRQLNRRITIDELVALLERSGGEGNSKPSVPAENDGLSVPQDALDSMIEYMAIGVAAVINLFNPSTLFIHSRVLRTNDELFVALVAAAEQRALRPSFDDCHIVQARGSKRQGAVAAIIEHLFNSLVPMAMKDTHYLAGTSPRPMRVSAAGLSDSERQRAKEVVS